jgi:O-antigen ligase
MRSHTAVPVTGSQKLGFIAMAAFLFVLHSRVFDLILQPLHLPSIILMSAVIAAFVSGGVMRAFSNRIGACLLGLTVWMCMSVPFSVWRGHSVSILRNLWLISILVYFIAATLVYTWEHLRKVFHVLAAAILVLAIVAQTLGALDVNGRLNLGGSRYGNPNDLAQILLMGLPFWWFIATSPATKGRWRAFAYVATLPIFVTIAMTGSRGAFLATAGLLAVLFYRSSLKHKLQLTVAGILVVTFGVATLPQGLRERYFTFFKAPAPDRAVVGMFASGDNTATMSAQARWTLLKDSVVLTMRHPLFGVGPGGYDIAQDLYSREQRGVKGLWHHTHNTYTEISSENGIPGLALYIALIVFTWRLTRVERPRRRLTVREAEVISAAFTLRLALLTFCISAFFASFAYHPQLLLLAALTVSWKRTAAPILSGEAQIAEIQPRPAYARVLHPVWTGPRSRPA